MSQTIRSTPSTNGSAADLRRLNPAERDAALEAAALAAESEYRNSPSLTDFEAFGEGELYGDSADSEPR